MLNKEIVKEQINSLPEEFSLDDLVERLILLEKVQKGMLQSRRGEVIPDADLDKEIEKWFK